MNSRLQTFLQKLALTRGRRPYAPASNRDEDLRNFQDEVDEVEGLAANSLLNIVGEPHRESRTGKRYVDRINIELTASGVRQFALHDKSHTNDAAAGASSSAFDEKLSELKRDFEDRILSPLRSDLRGQGLSAYAAWKVGFLAFLDQYLPEETDRFKQLTAQSAPQAETQKENAYNRFMREEGKICLAFMETLNEAKPSERDIDSPRLFLSYAREDSAAARKLYEELSARGLNVWLDREALRPGQNWRVAVRQAIRESRYFLALLSGNSVSKIGYVQKELKDALDILEEHPISSVFIIPARLDDCTPADDRIRNLHWVDLFDDWKGGVDRIVRAVVGSV
jgi:hypothetical protein